MNKYLSKRDFMPIAENLSYGQKVRVNHDSDECQGDSNSMIVRVKNDGDISAYCFRCGKRGYHSNSSLKSKVCGADATAGSRESNGDSFVLKGIEEDTTLWPVRARVWVRKYGITDWECMRYGICYSSDLGRVILPQFDSDGLASYSTRRVLEDDTGSKYYSYRCRDVATVCYSGVAKKQHCVIVEDLLSAIKVGRYLPAMPIWSTRIRDIHVNTLIDMGFNKFTVFLDDDNGQVKRDALKNKRILDKIGECDIIHSDGKDPKEFTDNELQEILK